MLLKEIDFSVKDSPPLNDWSVDKIVLSKLNLIVGKNATGKSMILKLIINFADIVRNSSAPVLVGDFKIKFEFKDREYITYTSRKNSKNGELNEKLVLNDKIVLEVENMNIVNIDTKYLEPENFSREGSFLNVFYQNNNLLKNENLNEFISFADNLKIFKFGHFHSYLKSDDFPEHSSSVYIDGIIEIIEKCDGIKKQRILEDFNSIGYDINNISVKMIENRKYIVIEEKGLAFPINHQQMSQGMLRAFSLVTLLNNLLAEKKSAFLIIDDLAEGLDYERATKLGKLIFEKLKYNNLQLISTSNDRFLMNSVDIDFWNILRRNNNVIENFSIHNSKELFDKFDYSGLSNFDLFSSSFIDSSNETK